MGKPVLLERKAGFASIRMRDQRKHFVDLPPYYRKLFMHEPYGQVDRGWPKYALTSLANILNNSRAALGCDCT
jgi:hypothetical protein